jgi:hypothetical protein
MRQHVVQLGTFGSNVADKINELLKLNSGWHLFSVFNIVVHRIGGHDNNVLVVFESNGDWVEDEFKEAR